MSDIYQQLEAESSKIRIAQLEADVRKAQLEAEASKIRNALLEADLCKAQLEADLRNAELAELKEKLDQKDQFVLEYWEMMKNLLIAERRTNKELEAKNTELEAKNTELEASNTELEASNTELEASNTELEASNTELKIEVNWYYEQCKRVRSCATELTTVSW